jgi:hypothetical protein
MEDAIDKLDICRGEGCAGATIAQTTFTGYPCYLGGSTGKFALASIPLGFRDGTPAPTDLSYSWGPFGDNIDHLFTLTTSHPVGSIVTLALEYDGTFERALSDGVLSSQWLRRVSAGFSLSKESSLSLSFRSINGLGGFSTQIGGNLAMGFKRRWSNGNELYLSYGSPAADVTLNRLVLKFVAHAGA